jgi:exonuclease III
MDWLYIQNQGLTFAVQSLFQSVENTHHVPTSIFSQKVATLIKGGRGVTHRQAFPHDLATVIKGLQSKRIEVIISGDFNTEATSQSTSQLMKISCNLELVSNPEAIKSTYKLGKPV